MVCTLLAGVNVVAFAAEDVQTVTVAKFYNDAKKGGDGEHLFTKDLDEMSWLSSLPTWNNEGVAWKAPVSSNTTVFRCYNPTSGEHLYVDEGYADYLAGMGWNKEKLAFYSDDEMGVPVYRLWNGAEGVGSHHYTTDAGEVDWLVGQGWTKEDIAFYGVDDGQIVESAKIIDVSGLQADGTGLVGDTLQVTYTAEIGNPQQVTWYKNGSAVYTSTASGAQGLEFTLTIADTPVLGAGTYEAVITNALGETTKSDSLVVSALPVKAVLSDYGLTEDYESGVDKTHGTSSITYNAKTNKFVATVTVNKSQYTGTFGVIEAEKAMSGKATQADILASALTNNPNTGAELFTEVKDPSKFTDKSAVEVAAGYGIYFDNKDGSRTYKWVVNKTPGPVGNTNPTRGESYVLGFAQNGVSDASKPETYAIAGLATAPYVEAPEAIAITKCANGENVEVSFVDAEGNKLEWLGGVTPAYPTAAGAQDIGIKEAVIYKNTSNGETGKSILDSTSKDVLKGTLTTAQPASTAYSYYWAEVTFEEGIFDEGEVTLKSPIQKIATLSADAMNLYENPLSPSDAIVKFTNLATDGTVYVVNANTVQDAQQALKDEATTGDNRITGYAEAKRGDATVDVSNCLRSTEDKKTTYDNYYAFFVPENPLEYSMVGTNGGTHTPIDGVPEINPNSFEGLQMVQLPARYSMEASVSNVKDTTALTGATIYVATNKDGAAVVRNTTGQVADATKNLVKVVDQFGYELTAANYALYGAAGKLGSWELKQSGSAKTDINEMDVDIILVNGKTAISVNPLNKAETTMAVDANTTWVGYTAALQTVSVTAKTDGSWTITIQ